MFIALTNPTIPQKGQGNCSQDNWFLVTICSVYIGVLYIHHHISSLQHEQKTTPCSLPPRDSPNTHNTMDIYNNKYSTFNYLNQQCRVLFQKFMYFRMVEKFSPFDGIQRFTTLDYFLGQPNLIHNLLLLILIWGVQTNAQPIRRIYKEPPTATLLHCN